jgi:hypothetical protein
MISLQNAIAICDTCLEAHQMASHIVVTSEMALISV